MNILQKLENIKKWIKDNENIKDPNFYEIVNYLVEIAELKNDKNSVDIAKAEELMNDIISLRGLNLKEKENINQLFKIEEKREMSDAKMMSLYFITKIKKDVENDIFIIERDKRIRFAKKEVLRKTASLNLYIFQQKRDNPDYHYDNEEEFSEYQNIRDYYFMSSEKNYAGEAQYQNIIKFLSNNIEHELENSRKKKKKKTL